VLETLNDLELTTPVVRVGWPDAFIEHGKVEALRAKYGLTAEGAMIKAATLLRALVNAVAKRTIAAK
jgi:1-deoxy-D-xylulose-5-phosphate synthase